MSRMNELSAELDELKRCGEILIGISDTLRELFSTDVEEKSTSKPKNQKAAIKEPPEPAKKSISLTDVRAVLAEKSRNGYTADVKALLIKYGADKLSDINPADYEALLVDAEVFGHA
ncbi:DNA ligase [Anaerocolumna sedimenticola]|uniref:DNA ligase n=1 Tax=Anaerocolumna sedimenticola TaxID=2696063 RepID=A0A6P1TQC2_9FIRM|nr:DNA ligase [Anaerocolumna sedimenticola]QHQ62673.1 DNA ligase [Anaerocolumna sedimenticola]